jgi:hypothetical protein
MRSTHHHKKGGRKISKFLNGEGVSLNMLQLPTPNQPIATSLMSDPFQGSTNSSGGAGSTFYDPGAVSSPPVLSPVPITPMAVNDTLPAPSSNGSCPNPGTASIVQTSIIGSGATTQQSFRIGSAVNPGFVYSWGVYGVTKSVTAVSGDTASSIAQKLANAINQAPMSDWQNASNNHNYKPSANVSGDSFTSLVDSQHSAYASGSGSCSATVPTTDPVSSPAQPTDPIPATSPVPTTDPVSSPAQPTDPSPTTDPVPTTDPSPTSSYQPPVVLPFPIFGVSGLGGGGSPGSSDAPTAAQSLPLAPGAKKWFTYFVIAVAAGCVLSYLSVGKTDNAITDLNT